MWIRRLGEERLLSRGERDIGWRKDPRPRPRHLGDAILVEQSPALVVGSPWGCSVHHRLGEQYDRPRRYVRNDHAGGLFRGLVDLARQLEVTLVTPGNAPESPRCRSGIGKIPGHDREPLVDAVRSKVKVLSWLREGIARRSPVVRVHGPHGLPLVHADAVETVQPKAVPEPKAKNWQDRLMIQQATERLPPVEEAMIRSVQAGGGAKADAFARAGESLRIDQSIHLGHLRRPQDVMDHQIALKIEKVLLQLLVRSVHGHTLPRLFCHRRIHTTLYRSVRKPDRFGPGVNANMSAPAPAHLGDQARDQGGSVVRAVCRGEGEVRRLAEPIRGPKEVSGGSVRLLLFRREATGLRGGPRVGSKPSWRNAMSEPRFTTLAPETMTADQKRVADAIQSGPRGAGLRGPFNALLRSPELCDLVQRVGAFVRFGTSIPPRLNELAIIMAGRKWTAQYEFYAHRRLALEAGLSPAIADAIAANQRPASMAKDEETVYDFVSELLATGSVSDPTFQRVKDAFGERGVVDLIGAVGYYSLVSMTLNVAQVPLPAGVTPPLK